MSPTEMNANDMLALSKKFAQNLNSFGFNVKSDDIVECKLFDDTRQIGYTEILGAHKFCLHINKKLCKENKTEFRKNVIYHELAHIIQYNEAFDQKVIKRNEQFGNTEPLPGKEALAHKVVYDNIGHTIFWRDLVKEIQARIQFALPIVDFANEFTIEKMLEELFVREAENYINEDGHFVHVDYVIGGLSLADIEKYSDKVPVRTEDLREALAKVDFSKTHPITPPGYKGPNATIYYSQKYIDEFEQNKNNENF